jgi:Bacterial protein of unknown function (DUF922)
MPFEGKNGHQGIPMASHGLVHHLRWSDFRRVSEPPDGEGDAQTLTVTQMHFRFLTASDDSWKLTAVDVTLKLDAKGSWVIRGKETTKLLAHEQVHYDIAAVAARTLDARLRALNSNGGGHDANSAARDVQDTIFSTAATVQVRYDADTDHGRDAQSQAIWARRVHTAFASQKETIDDLASWQS